MFKFGFKHFSKMKNCTVAGLDSSVGVRGWSCMVRLPVFVFLGSLVSGAGLVRMFRVCGCLVRVSWFGFLDSVCLVRVAKLEFLSSLFRIIGS